MGSPCIEQLEPRRLMNAGGLDNTFGAPNRAAFLPLPGAGRLLPVDVDVTPAGQIVVTSVGNDSAATTQKIQLTRLNADGSLDKRFGPDGSGSLLLETPTPSFTPVHTHLTPDGSGVVLQVGNFLYKLGSNGRWDRAFGSRGRVIIPTTAKQDVEDLTIDPQGRIVTVGRSATGDLEFRRLQSNGSADPSFGTNGVLAPPSAVADVGDFVAATRIDGSMFFAGRAAGTTPATDVHSPAFDTVAAKLRPDGTFDTTYGFGGVNEEDFNNTEFETATFGGVSISPYDGWIFVPVLISSQSGNNRIELHGFDPTGTAAPTRSAPDLGEGPLTSADMLSDADLRLWLGGRGLAFLDTDSQTLTPPSTAANGNLDLSHFEPRRVTLDADGSILVLSVQNSAAGNMITLSRLFRDDAPAGLPTARTLAAPKTGSYRFTIPWRDDDGVDAASLGNDDVTVKFPTGQRRHARLVGTVPNGPGVIATYAVTPPDGSWSAADNGQYNIRVERRSVRDNAGNFAPQRVIGGFAVQISTLPPAGAAVAGRVSVAAAAVTPAPKERRVVDDLFGGA